MTNEKIIKKAVQDTKEFIKNNGESIQCNYTCDWDKLLFNAFITLEAARLKS